MLRSRISIIIFLLAFFGASAQDYELQPTTETYKDLQKLHRGLRVLYLAAHPDDENTRLIAWLENEKSIETAYLSLTRGQGGQNLIGDQKGDALGVIRTYELLEARKIDGGEQMFTRAVDFGYSKSAKESFEKWGKEAVLEDVVYAIRKFRPHIIITRFPPDRNAGHGHHEASAILAAEAYDLAGDKTAFPKQLQILQTWHPQALYFNTSSWWRKELQDKSAEELREQNILKVNIGVYDELTGLGVNEIASLARSKHRCQAFGTSRDRGERFEYLQLLKGEWKDDLFDGYEGIWSRSPEHKSAFHEVIEAYSFTNPQANYEKFIQVIEPRLAQRSLWAEGEDIAYVNALSSRIKQNMLGVRVEASASKDAVVVGTDFEIAIEAYNGGVESVDIRFSDPDIDTSLVLKSGTEVVFKRTIKAPGTSSTPHWLRNPHGDVYQAYDGIWIGQPRNVERMLSYTIKKDVSIKGQTELHRKWVDRSIGEVVQPMMYVPLVSITPNTKSLVFVSGKRYDFSFNIKAFADVDSLSILFHDHPVGKRFGLKKGEQTALTGYTKGSVRAQEVERPVVIDGKRYNESVRVIDYEHIPQIAIVEKGTMTVTPLELSKVKGKILYIEGSGDEVDESLELIGYEVHRMSLSEVNWSKVSDYKAIISGIRVYNRNDEILAYQERIMRYVEEGGNYIVQYNTSRGLKSDNIGPYPFQLSRERVTEEDAAYNLLAPDHRVFNKPNSLTSTDFEGWVQERGLYFAGSWDDRYTPLISWKDKDEDAMSDGALLVASYGKGSFFYSGISFFRQLPAGVPGAYRLLVNMIEYKP